MTCVPFTTYALRAPCCVIESLARNRQNSLEPGCTGRKFAFPAGVVMLYDPSQGTRAAVEDPLQHEGVESPGHLVFPARGSRGCIQGEAMADVGVYGVILRWGLETLSGVLRDKDPSHLQIVVEAMRLRNAIVLRRFEFAWAAAQELVSLAAELDTELAKLITDTGKAHQRPARLRAFIHLLSGDLHPRYYRRLRIVRGKFESTNDLFSAYSLEFMGLLQMETVKNLLKQTQCDAVADAAHLYRRLWENYATTMLSLLRVTSSDIRFWVIDASYFRLALRQASADCRLFQEHLVSGSRRIFSYGIEDPATVRAFWACVDQDLQGDGV